MTTPAKIGQPTTPSGSGIRLTALPDPPQIPDMATQLPDIARALYTLEDYYRAWGNVAVMGNCYLRQDGDDARRAPYPDLLVGFDMPLDPAEIVAANGYSIGEIWQAAGLRAGGGVPIHGPAGLHRKTGNLRPLSRGGILAV